jgi:hypothetical protein
LETFSKAAAMTGIKADTTNVDSKRMFIMFWFNALPRLPPPRRQVERRHDTQFARGRRAKSASGG